MVQGTGQVAQQASLEAALSEARSQLAEAHAQLATATSGVSAAQVATAPSAASAEALGGMSPDGWIAAAVAAPSEEGESKIIAELRARVAELERGVEMADAEAGELREALAASEHIRSELSRQLATVEEGVASRVAMLKAQVCKMHVLEFMCLPFAPANVPGALPSPACCSLFHNRSAPFRSSWLSHTKRTPSCSASCRTGASAAQQAGAAVGQGRHCQVAEAAIQAHLSHLCRRLLQGQGWHRGMWSRVQW